MLCFKTIHIFLLLLTVWSIAELWLEIFIVWIIKDLAMSPRSLPLRTFCETSLVASGEERGETAVFAGYQRLKELIVTKFS